MACFLAPMTEAIVTTVIKKTIDKKENPTTGEAEVSKHLSTLNGLLWGGSGLLAFEHLWHGEIAPFPPFLTAMSNSADTVVMLHEIVTNGTAMAVLVTSVWGVITAIKVQRERGKHIAGTEGQI